MKATLLPRIDWIVPWALTGGPAPEYPVTTIEEGGYLVRGTVDRVSAARAVVAYQRTEEGMDGFDASVPPLDRVGWFRWNPCSPRSCWDGGGHSGHLGYVDGPGRGRWQGVYFAW